MSTMHAVNPREKKLTDWRHNDRPNKPRNASPHLTHKCETCGAKLSRKGVNVRGYGAWCSVCRNVLKMQYMSPEFKAQIIQYTES